MLVKFFTKKDSSSIGSDEHSWKKLNSSEEPRYGHTSFVHQGKLYIIGGSHKDGSFSDSVLTFDFVTNKWEKIETDFPARHFQASCIIKQKVFVFGGKSNGYRNDLLCAKLPELKWEELETKGKKPTARYGHSCVPYGNSLFIFGGYENGLSMTTNELWKISTDTLEWQLIKVEEKPPSRFQHTAELAHRNGKVVMLVFGGKDDKEALSDLWEYTFAYNKWAKLTITQDVPKPRFGHCSFAANHKLYIIGGKPNKDEKSFNNLVEIDLDSLVGKSLNEKDAPSQRFNATLVPAAGYAHLFGGRDESGKIYGELYKQDLHYCFIDTLSKNVLVKIFGYLKKEDLSNLMRQNRKLYRMATDNLLWKQHAIKYRLDKYIPKEMENEPNIYYRAVNVYVLNSYVPPPSGSLVWRNPAIWNFDPNILKKKKFLNTSKWKK